jgi:hypothetical protein
VSDAERAAIFAGNAERLVGSVQTGPPDATPPALPRVRITDVHAHVGRFPYPAPWEDEVQELERSRQVFNMGEVLVSSTDAIAYDPAAGNRVVADLLLSHAWLRGYVVVNPRDRAGAIAELDRWAGRQDFVGVKVHAEYSAVPTASRPMADLFAEIARRARVVKIHNSGPDWATALAEFARAWRSLNVVVAHAGPGQASDDAINLAHTEPNVYLEFCTTSPVRDVIRAAIQQAGVDKVLFGSDQLLIDPAYVLGAYQDARLTETEWQAVGHANPHRVFDL